MKEKTIKMLNIFAWTLAIIAIVLLVMGIADSIFSLNILNSLNNYLGLPNCCKC